MKPHYQRIRKVKTHSGSTAIQVGSYKGKNFILRKHIGSAKDTEKVRELIYLAEEYIRSHSPQLAFNFNPQSEEILFKRGVKVKKACLKAAYDYLKSVYGDLGLNHLRSSVLKYFAMMRVLEPASKIKSIALLNKYFGIHYTKTTAFRELGKLATLKEEVIKAAIVYAQRNLHFDFSLVFYDVTTLYFESFKADEDDTGLRKHGFSKDNKVSQPQILIGLVVNRDGFPSTMIFPQVQQIANSLNRVNHKTVRVDETIYEYSTKRATKDKADNDKQLQKALYLLSHPGKVFKRSALQIAASLQNILSWVSRICNLLLFAYVVSINLLQSSKAWWFRN